MISTVCISNTVIIQTVCISNTVIIMIHSVTYTVTKVTFLFVSMTKMLLSNVCALKLTYNVKSLKPLNVFAQNVNTEMNLF